MKPSSVTSGCVTCGERPGAAGGYVCACHRTKGYLLSTGRHVFFTDGSDVFRSPVSAPLSVTTGYQMAARFFCPVWQWVKLQESGLYPFEQQALVV
jgi:hypothetical protein